MTSGIPALVVMFTETGARGSVSVWAYIMDGDEEIVDMSQDAHGTMGKAEFRKLAQMDPEATIGTGKLVWLLGHVAVVPAVSR